MADVSEQYMCLFIERHERINFINAGTPGDITNGLYNVLREDKDLAVIILRLAEGIMADCEEFEAANTLSMCGQAFIELIQEEDA